MCWWSKKKTVEPIVIPQLIPSGTIDINLMSSVLLDKLEEMGDDKAELYLADNACKVYRKDDAVKFLGLDEIDKITYVTEIHDCDDFAAELYGKGIPLIWTNTHAFNWFIDDTNTLWFIEPQTDTISNNIQNWDVRFFLSR